MGSDKLGIILAGGSGTRLKPLTNSINKHLLPVFDKPMIYYPIATLMQAGIRNIVIISSEEHIDRFKSLLGDGSKFGVSFGYRTQKKPGGIPQAFEICIDLLANKEVWLILGDNIFFGQGFSEHLKRSMSKDSQIFALKVKNPKDFGVVELDYSGSPVKILEKPEIPKSNLASVGLYRYKRGLEEKFSNIVPSARGELEITDINNLYIQDGELEVNILGRGLYWCDTGTIDRLLEASNFIRLSQNSNNYLIGCPEEIGINNGWLDSNEILQKFSLDRPRSSYEKYVYQIAKLNYEGIKDA